MNPQLNFKLLLIGGYKPMRPLRLPYNDILRQAGQWKSCLVWWEYVASSNFRLKVSVFASIFKFLTIPNSRRITLLEETALESSKAFDFLHQTRRAAIHPQNPGLFQGASLPTTLDEVATVNGNVDQLKSIWKPEKNGSRWQQQYMDDANNQRRINLFFSPNHLFSF
jgi:hypothetical protein